MTEVLAVRGSFPLKRETRFLTRLNRLDDGSEYRLYEQPRSLCRWDFNLRDVSAEEASALEGFFERVGGRYAVFAFLDPTENLLLWSEDYAKSPWEAENAAYLSTARGLPDPLAGNAADCTTNSGPADCTLTQWLAFAPAGIELTASIWARNTSGAPASLALKNEANEGANVQLGASPNWRRYSARWSFSPAGASTRVGFELRFPPGSSVELFGAQLMALPAPGDYTKTRDTSGFHPRCRFDSDVLAIRHDAPGLAQTKVSIVELV